MLVIDLLVGVRVLFLIANQKAFSELVEQFALGLMCSLLLIESQLSAVVANTISKLFYT